MKNWKRNKITSEKNLFLIMLLIFIFSTSAILYYKNYVRTNEEFVELKISSVNIYGETAMVILNGNCRQFSFSVPKPQGESLLYVISKYNFTGSSSIPSGIGGMQSTMRIVQGGQDIYGEMIVQDMLSIKTGLVEAIALALETKTPILIKKSMTEKVC